MVTNKIFIYTATKTLMSVANLKEALELIEPLTANLSVVDVVALTSQVHMRGLSPKSAMIEINGVIALISNPSNFTKARMKEVNVDLLNHPLRILLDLKKANVSANWIWKTFRSFRAIHVIEASNEAIKFVKILQEL